MEIAQTVPLLPGDPRLIDHIICLLKSQGLFDQFRKECISDVDTKPAYQNLRQRVEGSVAGFLTHQKWKPDLNKNQLREKLRKHILDSKFLDQGVERIVDQVVNPKISSVFIPQVEEVVYKCFGLEKPNRPNTSHLDEAYDSTSGLQLSTGDLLPNDLEAVSPDSEKSQDCAAANPVAPVDEEEVVAPGEEENITVCQVDDSMLKVETVPLKTDTPYESDDSDTSKDEEFESPAFEPIEGGFKQENSPNNSHLSGISDLTSHDSSDSSNDKDKMVDESGKPDMQNTDSQLSQVSSDSNLSVDGNHSGSKPGDGKFNISTGDDDNKVLKIESSDTSNTPCYKFSNDDNSSDARQSFDNSDKKMEVVGQESDVFEDSSADGIFTKNVATDPSSDDVMKNISSSEAIEAVTHHRSSIESKTSTESVKDAVNIDMSIDSESKSSDVSADNTKSGAFDFEMNSFENRLTAEERSMDADDSSSNDLKIDLQAAVSEEVDDSSSNGLKIDLKETVQSDLEMKEEPMQDVEMKMKSPSDEHFHKSNKDRDEESDRYKIKSKDGDRKLSVSHSHSKDHHKDKRDDSKHHSKSSRHSSSSRRDSERKHSSSSSHDKKDSSRSKSSSKDSQSAEKDKYTKSSSNGESSSRKERHSSGHRSSTSHRHSSSSSRHHSSSSKYHSDDISKPRHSSSSDKNEKSSPQHSDKGRHSSGQGSSQRDRKHSTQVDERRRTSSSNSMSDKKQDDKKSKSKSSKDDHYSSSGRGGKPRRSTDRDSNDGNNGSTNRSQSHSTGSSGAHNNTSNKSNSKSSTSGTDNGSSGNSSSGGQSNSLNETTINITKGSYIKSEFNMFQPIVKKPTLAELHLMNRSPEAAVKKPVVHVDSQLNPVKVEEQLVEPPPPAVAVAVPPLRKPRFASNVFEARKLMKVRKQMEKMERRKQQEATKLLEEQQNIPKSESQVFSGLSGPELEFACVKGYSNNSHVKESRTHQNYAVNRKDSIDDVPDLLYFDNNPKSKAQIDYERAIRCLKKYLAVYSGVSEKKQTVLHLIKCDNGLEEAFKRLSTKDHKIKTVNLRQNGAIAKWTPYKRVKSKAKSQNESNSDLKIPESLQFGKMISNFVFDQANSFMNKEPFVELENLSSKMITKMKATPNTPKKKKATTAVNDTRNEYCRDAEDISDFNQSFSYNDYYDGCNDYYGEFDDSVLQASKQDIMEIILGSGVNFDSAIIDMKRLHHLNSDISSTSTLQSNVDLCNGKLLTVAIRSMDSVPAKGRKRNASVHFEDDVMPKSKVNHNNNFKTDCTTPKKRKLSERTMQGLTKSKTMKSPLDIPCSPESDKSVENHINHNSSGKVKGFMGRTAMAANSSGEAAPAPLDQSTQQMVKSIVRGCLGDNNVFKTKFVEQGQRKIATGFKRSHH